MQNLLRLKPIFQERIWGGTKLQDMFEYTIPSEKTGECWAISAHQNGDCLISNGPLKGKRLSDVYQNHRELFNNCESPVFPLLTKILDASKDLSVQVHPDDTYGLKVEGELGKTECWYIIDCDEDAEMVYGHHAQSKEELIEMIKNNKWSDFLRRVKIKPGDFFYVPSGTLHALCEGTLVLETQQSSDTTYRVYDYDREDQAGNKRPLHIDKAIDVIKVPHEDAKSEATVVHKGKNTMKQFVKSPFFTVELWEINEKITVKHESFYLVSVLKGKGTINNQAIEIGDHMIVTTLEDTFVVEGDLKLMVASL